MAIFIRKMATPQGSIPEIIENNTVAYFLSLGHAVKNEICDAPKIKYIFNDRGHSRIFKANFSDEEASSRINWVMSRFKGHDRSALWFITPSSRPKSLESRLKEQGFNFQRE